MVSALDKLILRRSRALAKHQMPRTAYLIRCTMENGQSWFAHNCNGDLCEEYDRKQDAKAAQTRMRNKNAKPNMGPKVRFEIETFNY